MAGKLPAESTVEFEEMVERLGISALRAIDRGDFGLAELRRNQLKKCANESFLTQGTEEKVRNSISDLDEQLRKLGSISERAVASLSQPWLGQWEIEFQAGKETRKGWLTLASEEASISGEFALSESVSGTFTEGWLSSDGMILTGRWTNEAGKQELHGQVEFRMNPDDPSQFQGNYSLNDDPIVRSPKSWNGVRNDSPFAPVQQGPAQR
jgi:hypothetical protein